MAESFEYNSAEQRNEAMAVDAAIASYKAKYGCGDSTCTSCPQGIAIGLAYLDDAYDAGYAAAVNEAE